MLVAKSKYIAADYAVIKTDIHRKNQFPFDQAKAMDAIVAVLNMERDVVRFLTSD